MAKKSVASLQKERTKGYTKVIKMVRSGKGGAYAYKEAIVPTDEAEAWIKEA